MGEDKNEIKCIFFSEFHPTAGPKIVHQVPEEYFSKEEFDAVHVYIITKPELQNRIITINTSGHKILGCPVCIGNPKYARNALIFNLCFVFDKTASTVQFETIVKKLAEYLTTLEMEMGFLTQTEPTTQMPRILGDIRDDLNQLGMSSIPINESTTIHLKVVPAHTDPSTVLPHQVPIAVIGNFNSRTIPWDMATRQLMPYIDGFKHVARIATEADVDINIVKVCIQNLVYQGAVKLIPIFKYSNVYVVTPNINEIAEDRSMQEECLSYVAKPGKVVQFRHAFQLYCCLTAGTTVRDLCSRFNPHALGIDERKLIQYGLIKGLIRRLEKYPVKVPNEPGSSRLRHLYRWFDGKHSYDEICCRTGTSSQELDDKIESDPSIVISWK